MLEEAHKWKVKRHSLTCIPYTCGHKHFISQFLIDHHIYHWKEILNFVSVTKHFFFFNQCKTRGMPTQREKFHHGTKYTEPSKWSSTVNC